VVDLGAIVRGEGAQYLQTRFTSSDQCRALRDIARCRTKEMGSVERLCEQCGGEYRLFRSCRNRSCPLCQGEARASWLAARKAEILPCQYLHVVFNVPSEFNDLAQYCPKPVYDAIIRAAGQAVIDVGRRELHAQLGCQVQLHTWSRTMARHLHAHCMVPCGGFSEDGSRWISFEPDDLRTEALANRFRTLLCRKVRAAARQGRLDRLPEDVSVDQVLATVVNRKWNVYARPPFGGPEKLLEYLAQSMYRVAISNDRIESYENHQVTYEWRDYRGGNKVAKPRTVDGQEFLRRFLMHVPPKGFVRIRSFGFLGNRNRKQNIERARRLIGESDTPAVREPFRPLRLCPACCERAARRSHFAPPPEASDQFDLPLRSPPTQHAA
jgi:Putative transposase/Transposase zinc-binding domain